MSNPTPLKEHSIPLNKAIEMTRRYRKDQEKVLADPYKGKNILSFSETFSKKALMPFFINDECEYIRIYFGMDDEMKVHSILVGANAKDEDLLPSSITEDDNEILEEARRCPDFCPPPSDLNTD
ncbi:MAG: hypothetical protein JWQ96_994 [Segetibacter sp.]|nr:hypothetical protein [Segetibacter sp.]